MLILSNNLVATKTMMRYSVRYSSDSQYNRRGGGFHFSHSIPLPAQELPLESACSIGRKEHIPCIVLEASEPFVGYITATIHDVIYLPPDMADNL
jgi:hypothetical protein